MFTFRQPSYSLYNHQVEAIELGTQNQDFIVTLRERSIRDAIYGNLRFLVFDELHTYRGRQGADVAMLIRRIRAKCLQDITSIGTMEVYFLRFLTYIGSNEHGQFYPV